MSRSRSAPADNGRRLASQQSVNAAITSVCAWLMAY